MVTTSLPVPYSSRRTFWIGFGFLGVSLVWALYNTYVPILLKESFALDSTQVGWVGTANNLLTLLLLPVFGAWSDRARTHLGKRFPFILIGAPLAALLFALIPTFSGQAAGPSTPFAVFLISLAGFNFAMATFRSPLVALMPDLTPSTNRSGANAIINLMGGIGALLAYFGGKPLHALDPAAPFWAGAALLALSCATTLATVRETSTETPDSLATPSKGPFTDLMDGLREVFTAKEKSPVFLLFSILLWFMGFSSIAMFFTTYAKFHLGWTEADGGMVVGFFALAFIASAISASALSNRFGRARIVRAGLVVLIAVLLALPIAHAFAAVAGFMVIAGLGWAWVNVNSLPMLLDSIPEHRLGAYTGVYYLFSMAGGVIAPPIAGWAMDTFGYGALPATCAVFYGLAMLTMLGVRRGEAK